MTTATTTDRTDARKLAGQWQAIFEDLHRMAMRIQQTDTPAGAPDDRDRLSQLVADAAAGAEAHAGQAVREAINSGT